MEERPLQTATRMETRRKVVRTEGSAHRSARSLQKYRSNKKDRKAYLYVGQCRLEQNHSEEPSMALSNNQINYIILYNTVKVAAYPIFHYIEPSPEGPLQTSLYKK